MTAAHLRIARLARSRRREIAGGSFTSAEVAGIDDDNRNPTIECIGFSQYIS